MGDSFWRRKTVIAVSGIGILLSLTGLIIVIVIYVITARFNNMYTVVMDAGSSSTKMSLYKWSRNVLGATGEASVVAKDDVEPGISAHISDPFVVYTTLSDALGRLTQKITDEKSSDVPVYLAATAGMRLQLIRDPMGSMGLLEVVLAGFLKSGYQFNTPDGRIRMLTGAEEGLYGWISVNSLLKLINEQSQADPLNTVGSLDLGGASTQIAFVSDVDQSTVTKESVNLFQLKMYGKSYNVYTHSFLCYGKDQFENRMLASMVQPNIMKIDYPCLLKGHTLTGMDVSKIFNSPCVMGDFALKAFGSALTKPVSPTLVDFVGTGTPSECENLIKSQFKTTDCFFSSCSFNGIYQPPVRGNFRAYSAFAFGMNYIIKDKVAGFTRNEVRQKVTTFCQTDSTELPNDKMKRYAVRYCFDGFYILQLLEMYGFKTDEQFKMITFENKIDEKPVSWATGYLLDQSNQLLSKRPEVHVSLPLFSVLTVIVVILLLLSILCLVLLITRRKKNESSQELT